MTQNFHVCKNQIFKMLSMRSVTCRNLQLSRVSSVCPNTCMLIDMTGLLNFQFMYVHQIDDFNECHYIIMW
jgi:hypothetical protein